MLSSEFNHENMKHIDVIFNVKDTKQQVLIENMIISEADFGMDEGEDLKRYFKVHLNNYPGWDIDRLRGYYEGVRDELAGNPIKFENGRRPKVNNRAIRILNATMEDDTDKPDSRHWDHLAIIFPNEHGKVPNFIKYHAEDGGDVIPGKKDKYGRPVRTPLRTYWKVQYKKKVLVIGEHASYPKRPEVFLSYDRVWVVDKEIMSKMTMNCKSPRCRGTMQYPDAYVCPGCDKMHESSGGKLPSKVPLCKKCKINYEKRVYVKKMKCDTCGKLKKHPKVVYMGPLTDENLQKFDFISEYEKVME